VGTVKQIYFIDGLSILHRKLGKPAWFWPLVLSLIFVVLPCVASAL